MGDVAGCELVVVLEDGRHLRFAEKALKGLGFQKRNCRIRMATPGKGSAEQSVRQTYVAEVRLYRKRRKAIRPNSGILTVIDADLLTVEERKRELDDGLSSGGLGRRGEDERIAIWVPRRHIETWLVHLCGNHVTEEVDVKRQRPTVDERVAANEFLRLFHEQNQHDTQTLPSIRSALQETRHIRE